MAILIECSNSAHIIAKCAKYDTYIEILIIYNHDQQVETLKVTRKGVGVPLKDVRKLAETRANQAKKKLGQGIESERKRAREAARQEANSYQGQGVQKIAAQAEQHQTNLPKKRVAAYCRVSTDDVGQIISIEYQKNTYRDKIKGNPDWIYAGTYVDDGFSGTNTEHRPAFQLMMKRAMAGEINMIITKSVSRFARNLLDCIGWIEELSKLEPPVRVYFEQENIDTLAQTSNIILFVLAMVAEEESHMKSEAMQLSLEWRFSRGRFITPRVFGYDKVEVDDGFGGRRKVLKVNEAEARVVRWIYTTFVNGENLENMAGMLSDLKIPTGGRKKDGSLNTVWTSGKLAHMLRYERYCGDVLARKTYTPNFKTHKARKNDGKKNKYYQPGHHEAIVSRSLWNAAQRILNSHRYGHKGTYLPLHMITDGLLAGYISMSLHWAGYATEDYYRCSSIAMGFQEGELQADLENEYLPNGGFRISGLMDDQGIQQIARELTKEEQLIKAELEGQNAEDKTLKQSDLATKVYQVVSGEMFSRVTEPVIRISPKQISFSKKCVERLNRYKAASFVELLFNPVERMLIVRPCEMNTPNAVPWDGKSRGAKTLVRIFYETMDWDEEYAYKIPATLITHGENAILIFDMDNYIGYAINPKVVTMTEAQCMAPQHETVGEENTKGIYYGPEDDEPEAVTGIEERFQEIRELNKRIYGTPAFQHQGDVRSFTEPINQKESGIWEMMKPAVPLDGDHCTIAEKVNAMLRAIIEDPPQMPHPVKNEALEDVGEVMGAEVVDDIIREDDYDEGQTDE